MSSEENQKKTENRLSVTAIIISIFALIASVAVPLLLFYLESERERRLLEENLSIMLSSIGYSTETTYRRIDFRNSTLSGIQYSIIISNNSNQRVSIVDSNIFLYRDGASIEHSYMFEGITDAYGHLTVFPITLDSGESRKYIIHLSNLVTSTGNINEIGTGALFYIRSFLHRYQRDGIGETVNFRELREYLDGRGYDIYSNSKIGDSRLTGIEIPKFPVYRLELVTSRGNTFVQLLSRPQLAN